MRLFFAAFLCAALFAKPAAAGDLVLSIEGLNDASGSVIGALFVDNATFMDRAKAYRLFRVAAAAGQVKYILHDLPPGQYAITVCHDANNNGKMDKNFIGIPLEGFGFSNNPKVTTRRPTFAQTAFTYDGRDETLSIKMTYMKF